MRPLAGFLEVTLAAAAACFDGVFRTAVFFLPAADFPVVFFATDFFFAAGFVAPDFLGADFFDAGFFEVCFFAVVFRFFFPEVLVFTIYFISKFPEAMKKGAARNKCCAFSNRYPFNAGLIYFVETCLNIW